MKEKKFKELQADSKHTFEDLKRLKSKFAYFVHPFICDIEDKFPISEMLLAEKAAGQLVLRWKRIRHYKCNTNLLL